MVIQESTVDSIINKVLWCCADSLSCKTQNVYIRESFERFAGKLSPLKASTSESKFTYSRSSYTQLVHIRTIDEIHTSSDSERNSCMMSLSPITRTEQTRDKYRDREREGGQSKSNKQRKAKCLSLRLYPVF